LCPKNLCQDSQHGRIRRNKRLRWCACSRETERLLQGQLVRSWVTRVNRESRGQAFEHLISQGRRRPLTWVSSWSQRLNAIISTRGLQIHDNHCAGSRASPGQHMRIYFCFMRMRRIGSPRESIGDAIARFNTTTGRKRGQIGRQATPGQQATPALCGGGVFW